MADIFVSYKKENRAYAERFAQRFTAHGFTVWWDDRITPEKDWDAAIEQEIAAATSVVVLWSPLSVASDWVRREAYYGHDRGKLVPVKVEHCELPLAFQLTQTVDLTSWDGGEDDRRWRKLLSWIADLRAAPPGQKPDAATGGRRPANPFHAAVGRLASGEPVVDGTFVNEATPAGTLFQDHADAPVMRIVPRGEFLLGAASEDHERTAVEGPQKRIHLGRPFAVAVYPVTQAQYDRYVPPAAPPAAQAPSRGWFARREAKAAAAPARPAADCAANHVSFDDAALFARALSHAVAAQYRLPSEAEWEYACRAGARGRYSWGDEIDATRAAYRWGHAAPAGPLAPGGFAPNAFGLYDMHGNVREWTEDLWHETYEMVPLDGRPAVEGYSGMRVTRGGGWSDPASMLRCSARSRATQTIRSEVIGLRVVRTL